MFQLIAVQCRQPQQRIGLVKFIDASPQREHQGLDGSRRCGHRSFRSAWTWQLLPIGLLTGKLKGGLLQSNDADRDQRLKHGIGQAPPVSAGAHGLRGPPNAVAFELLAVGKNREIDFVAEADWLLRASTRSSSKVIA